MISNESGVDPLPTRKSPQNLHTKLFQSCVPLSGLKRSFSLPRHSCFKHHTQQQPHYSKKGFQNSADYVKSPEPEESHQSKDHFHGQDNLMFEAFDISDDEKLDVISHGNSDSLTSEFCDPLLAELEMDLPIPPLPPPRAYPHWLKCALNKQAVSAQTSPNLLPLSPSVPVSNSKLKQQMSRSLEHNRFSVRIYPVIQNGVKISDTHYWLLDPPKPKHLHSTKMAISQTTTPSTSPLIPIANEEGYLNVDVLNACPSCEFDAAKDLKFKRGLSDYPNESLHQFHQSLVHNLMKKVPIATESECQAVLIGTNYNYDEAIKRLKLELLCRKGYFSRAHNKRLLVKYDWDLDVAVSRAYTEYKYRQLRREPKLTDLPQTRRRSKSPALLTSNFSVSSSSSTSSLPVH